MITRINHPIATVLTTLALSVFYAACASAEPMAKALNSGPDKTARQVFRQTLQGAEWRVLESDNCHIHVSYRGIAGKSVRHIAMDDCSGITDTEYKLLGDDVLIANWASERGGYAYVFRASGRGIQWLEVPYKSSEDSEFNATRNASTIFIKTDRSEINIRVSDEKLERLIPAKSH